MPRPSFLITVNVEADCLDQRPLLLTKASRSYDFNRCAGHLVLTDLPGELRDDILSTICGIRSDVLRRNAGEIGPIYMGGPAYISYIDSRRSFPSIHYRLG